MPVRRTGDAAPKIFVSYSRRDLAFVDRLDAALRARGVEPLIDRAEIFAFEDWWRRIQDLIAKADTIVFVLSPDAVASDVCRREVEFAEGLNKRFAPVVARPVDPADVPAALSRLNFIHLDLPELFDTGVERLIDALSTDIDWVRRHSEFGEMARRWAAAGRPGPHGLLLRPPMLEEAESWIASRPANAPLPTEETQAIIAMSRRAETQRRNRVTGALGLGLAVALLLSVVAFWQRQVARENERVAVAAQEAEARARKAEAEQRRLAEAREREAIEAGDRTLVGQSRFLADASARSLAERDAGTALLLALEALPDTRGGRRRPLVPEARQALDRALSTLAERSVAQRHAGFSLAFSRDGSRMASQGAGEIVVADGRTGEIVYREAFGRGETVALDLGAAGVQVLRCSADEVLLLDPGTGRHRGLDLAGGRAGLGPLVACRLGTEGVLLADRSGRVARWSGGAETLVPIDLPAGLFVHHVADEGILASTPNGEVQLRAARDGALRASLPGRGKPVDTAELSPDGERALARDADGLRIWDIAASMTRDVAVPRTSVVRLSPDGRVVLLHERWPMNSRGGGFELWDAQDGSRLARVDDTARLVALAFGADGRRLAGAGIDGSVRVFDTRDGREIARHLGHQGRPLSVAMGPDEHFVLSSGFDTRLVLWDLEARRPSRTLKIGAAVMALASRTDGEVLVAAGSGVRALNGTGDRNVVGVGGPIASLELASAGRTALAIRQDGEAVLVDIDGAREIVRLPGAVRSGAPGRGLVSPDGTRFVALTRGPGVEVRDASSGRELARHVVPLEAPATAAFVTNDRLLVSTKGGEAVVLDLRTAATVATIGNVPLGFDGRPLPPGRGPAHLPWEAVVASPDGTRLASADMLQPRIWDLASGRLLRILQDHAVTGSAGLLLFSPDGATLFTTERGRIVTAWDVESGVRGRSFVGHSGPITVLRMSPDGRYLLTGSEDRTARIWDVASGVEIAALRGHDGPIRDVLFAPPGDEIATASDDGTIRLWPFARDVQQDVERAQAAIGRCLTPLQRRRLYLDPTPPAWCFTGPAVERESDPAKWEPRAPYHMPLWQGWYRRSLSGEPVALPRTD